ncbi:hypothetical protein BH10ACI1_BH10ACI1_01620 [soil metagenome]
MKKSFSIALILVFLAFSKASAQDKTTTDETNKPAAEQTQERKITEAEFKAVQKKSADKTAGKNYSIKKTSKTYKKSDKSLMYFFNETSEYLLPDSSRSVVENGSASGGSTVTETIRIGQKTYTRLNNGEWQTTEARTNNSQNAQVTSGNTAEYTYKGKVELNEMPADLYESKYVTKTDKGGRDFITTTIVKSWFDKNGILLKTEESIETNNSTTQRVTEYEYGANINIEAPIK